MVFEVFVEKEIFFLVNRENIFSKKDVVGLVFLLVENDIVVCFKWLDVLKKVKLISEIEYVEKRR